MNFTTPIFFYFFILVFLFRWLISFYDKTGVVGKISLLFFSYLFYMSWDYRFAALLFFVTASDFYLAGRIAKTGNRIFLLLSVCIDLGILAWFKYSNFFLQNIQSVLDGLFPASFVGEVVLPLGISFYIFQSLGYTISVYRQETGAEKSLLDYALFLSFFPQLVAGPIVASSILLPQLKHPGEFRLLNLKKGFYFILSGFIKKSLLADTVSVYSDQLFAAPAEYSWVAALVGVVSYSIQIYCDFSGYSDIAIGLACLLGFELPENFNMPYLARGFSEFWNRWHITLSGWLRSFLYIPLGGNRISRLVTYRNLFVTMLLGGLWHGASWNFVVWGGAHGVLLAVERLWYEKNKKPEGFYYPVVTFAIVSLLWVFFRAETFQDSLIVLQRIFFLHKGAGPGSLLVFSLVVIVVLLGHLVGSRFDKQIRIILDRPCRWYEILLLVAASLVALFFSSSARPFIYFVF